MSSVPQFHPLTQHTILRLPHPDTAEMPKRHYINNEDGILSWLLTGDHKRIAMLYLFSITFFFFIGGAFAGLIRLELLPRSRTWSHLTPTTSFSPCTASS